MLLSVENVDVFYAEAQAIYGASLQLRRGEMVFLVGRNGAGKTTLLRSISGFHAPRAGTIRFEQDDLAGVRPEARAVRGVRYVMQDKRVFSALTVRENLQLAAHAVGVGLEQALEKVLEIYPRMEQFLDAQAGSLSGGQRQILVIGRALVGEPRLLLLDEPTEGLAAGVIGDIFCLLESMKGRLTMLIVEQNLAVVGRLADRVYIMKEGKIHAELTDPDEIRDQARLEAFL